MGSPAGVSSLLTSTDMKSIMFIALFLVAAVFCEAEAEAEASPDAYYGYYGHHGLVHGYGHLGYAHHGYGHIGYHGYGHHYGKREAEPYHGYYGHHGYHGPMATMDMDMDTAISTARGKLMPRLITMDTMVMAMDTDTMDMDIMDIMDITDTSTDKELRV